MQKLVLVLLVLIVLVPGTTAPAQPNLPADKVDRNVVYGMYSGLALLMDVYYPKQPNGIDPQRIGAVGGSSGGHLVSMLGLLDPEGDPNDKSPINRLSAKVQCVVARATPVTFLEGRPSSFVDLKENEINDANSLAYKRAKEASPITHVSSDDPPFLLLHGDKDDIVPLEMSEMLREALLDANVPVKLIRVKGAGHGPRFPGAVNPPNLDQARVDWFDKYLRSK